MKKVLSLILVLALAMSMLCTAAFAEGSKTDIFNSVGAYKKADLLLFNEEESALDVITAEEMASALAEIEGIDVVAENLVVVAQRDFTAEEYPVVVKFSGEGTEAVNIYQFVKYEGEDSWSLVYGGLAGEWLVEFEAAGTYAIAMLAD